MYVDVACFGCYMIHSKQGNVKKQIREDVLDNLIKYRDTHDIETYRIGLDKIKHTVEFGYVTYDHHSVEA